MKTKTTWKIWTWPRRMRALERALQVANEDKAHLIKALAAAVAQVAQHKHTERHRRGAHRSENA